MSLRDGGIRALSARSISVHGRYAKLMGPEIMSETGDEPAAFCEAVALACEVNASDYGAISGPNQASEVASFSHCFASRGNSPRRLEALPKGRLWYVP